ncbi:phytol kinase 1, chloroplastic isoform X2 [Helianthus annuus]|uniref:phytol kinase 1, chloroplastic isoform X2 n=1 Tax=Helianthus annuus TaxID=4232 RepID=UPI001652F57A|nr:phytol kinase 1, chloroplastic isoform X2 [Helianthus annuus]
MATHPTITTTHKPPLLRRHFCPPRYPLSPTTPFLTSHLIRNVPVDVYSKRRRFVLVPPRAFTVDLSNHLVRDAGATVLVVSGAYALVSSFDNLTQRQIIEQISTSTDARYFAALVPLLNCARLLVHGLSLVTNEDLIKSVTREGKPEELLRGPLYYVLMLILSTVVFWRESPIGVVSLSMMCGGDGIADIVGRRFGIHKIPYNKQKSWAGSISMFTVGFLISTGMLYYFSIFGYFELNWPLTIERVATVALVATLVESLPTKGGLDDNISVPLVSMLTAYLSFGFQP